MLARFLDWLEHSSFGNGLTMAIGSGAFFGLSMWFLIWRHDEEYSPSEAFAAGIVFGILTGLFDGIRHHRNKKSNNN